MDSRQTIDDAPKTEDIFIDDELFSDADTKDIKNLVDMITMETDVNEMSFDHEPVHVTPNNPLAPDPILDFFGVLLPKIKGKIRQQKFFLKSIKK